MNSKTSAKHELPITSHIRIQKPRKLTKSKQKKVQTKDNFLKKQVSGDSIKQKHKKEQKSLNRKHRIELKNVTRTVKKIQRDKKVVDSASEQRRREISPFDAQ